MSGLRALQPAPLQTWNVHLRMSHLVPGHLVHPCNAYAALEHSCPVIIHKRATCCATSWSYTSLCRYDPFRGFLRAIDTYVVGAHAQLQRSLQAIQRIASLPFPQLCN